MSRAHKNESEHELQPADEALFGALERLQAACESDPDLRRLAVGDLIRTEVATINEALAYILPSGDSGIIGLDPRYRFAPPTWESR